MEVNSSIAYLFGLITGKGRLHNDCVSISFPCANEFVCGTARCPKCSFPMTESSKDMYQCKNDKCNHKINKNNIDEFRNKYNQSKLIPESVKNDVISKISEEIELSHNIISSKNQTILQLYFKKDFHNEIVNCFHPQKNFYSFRIPEIIKTSEYMYKIEYLNGLLDTIGQPNAGNWIPRPSSLGMMQRIYFQIVNRNYFLPVDIDNFIREYFKIPIQTIDWGHPNIRDKNLVEFSKGNPSAYGREHQVKFYPEHYEIFKFRIKSKEFLFREFINFNKEALFDTSSSDWLNILHTNSEIKESDVKPYHPSRNHHYVPKVLRRQINAHWQINLLLGCKFLKKISNESSNQKVFEYFGIKKDIKNIESKIRKYEQLSVNLYEELGSPVWGEKKKSKKKVTSKNILKEIDTYEPLRVWAENHFKEKFNKKIKAFDTSKYNVNYYFSDERIESNILNLDDMNIKPDIVGIKENLKDIVIIESKITSLSVEDLGQILGYCLVAEPTDAFLISTEDLSPSLMTIIINNNSILDYGKGKIEIGKLTNNKVVLNNYDS